MSTAIKKNNIELKFAKKNKIPIYSRAEILADVVSLKKKYYNYKVRMEKLQLLLW